MSAASQQQDGRAAADAARVAVAAWIDGHWDPSQTLRAWWAALAESGWGFPAWPVGVFGRGLGRDACTAVAEAFDAAGVVGAPPGLSVLMGAPVTMQYGTDDQKARFVPAIARGEELWCQLFSEPGAGSDLASVACRAVRDGDEWVIEGQKVWTSGAAEARRGMLVARTDPDQPKHRGLTYFVIDLDQPGVEIRPIRQMNGQAHFNEVFFDGARVHDRDRIHDVNSGWAVTVATLGFERSGLSAGHGGGVAVTPGSIAGHLDRPVGDVLAEARARSVRSDEHGGTWPVLRALAAASPRPVDTPLRHDLVRVAMAERIANASRLRSQAAVAAGRLPGPEASVAKLFWTEGLRVARDTGLAILGPEGMLVGPDTSDGGSVQHFALTMPSASIAGGSDEVQRNIIGERALGLPKDLSVDTDVPFKELRRS